MSDDHVESHGVLVAGVQTRSPARHLLRLLGELEVSKGLPEHLWSPAGRGTFDDDTVRGQACRNSLRRSRRVERSPWVGPPSGGSRGWRPYPVQVLAVLDGLKHGSLPPLVLLLAFFVFHYLVVLVYESGLGDEFDGG